MLKRVILVVPANNQGIILVDKMNFYESFSVVSLEKLDDVLIRIVCSGNISIPFLITHTANKGQILKTSI